MATKKSKLKKATAKAPTVTAKETAIPRAPAGAPQPDPSALSIGDLKNLSAIIDVASTRGAFKAAEMAGVGLMYNKLQAFLAKVAPPEEKKEATPTTGTGTPSQGVGTTPSQGVGTTPSQGIGTTPSQGVGTTPSQGIGTTTAPTQTVTAPTQTVPTTGIGGK